jgi:rhamnogalacturonyl hydrolase YesR
MLFTLSVPATGQQSNTQFRADILGAISSCSDYMVDVLLDKDGKSRCDYQMLNGTWNDYEPPWHTGQIIYALVEAYQVTGNRKFLDGARKAGNWWVGMEITDPPALKGMVRAIHGDGLNYIVFATVTDGTAGLFRLQKATGDKRFGDVPTAAGKWMMAHMYNAEHRVFYDCVDPQTGNVMKEHSPFWPDKQKQTIFDVSRPNNEGSLFKDMYEYTHDERYRAMFIELCESLLQYQDAYGLWMQFVPNNPDGSFHPRFNLWYAESLLEGYELTKDRRYLEGALKTARMYAKYMQKDGTFYYTNYLDGTSNKNSLCGSATAFCGIVWLRLRQYGVGEEFTPLIERAVRWVLNNRYAPDHPDPNLAKGVLETRVRTKGSGVWLVNRDIGTSFGVRFLCDYYRSTSNTPPGDKAR